VNAAVLKGGKKIALSPASAVTDENGKVIFTVSGNKNTDEEPAEVQFTAGDLQAKLEVRVQTAPCVLGSIKISPEQVLMLEQGKSGTVTVKTKCRNDSPAVDIAVDARVQEGGNKIALSSTALLTDASGNAVFIVTGNSPTKKNPAKIQFVAEDLNVTLNVKVTEIVTGDAGTGTAARKPKTIETHPDQTLVMEKGKNVNATVQVKYKGNEPAAGVTVTAAVLKGKKKIEISPANAVTDENGRVVFTVTGNAITDKELAEVQFTAEDLQTKLEVRVQTTECVVGSIKTNPEQALELEQGKSGTVMVKTKCKNGSPSVDVKVGATIQEGSNKIAISSTALLTDASGNAIFTVTGNSPTKKNPAKIQFTAGDLKTTLNVKVKAAEETKPK
jgi:5-hydroxyisourate hydrolase-like protein (transthyretin family)